MALFEKREEVFCKRDREGWTAAKAALKAAGVRGMRAWHFEDEPPVGGCGCKLDIRNLWRRKVCCNCKRHQQSRLQRGRHSLDSGNASFVRKLVHYLR